MSLTNSRRLLGGGVLAFGFALALGGVSIQADYGWAQGSTNGATLTAYGHNGIGTAFAISDDVQGADTYQTEAWLHQHGGLNIGTVAATASLNEQFCGHVIGKSKHWWIDGNTWNPYLGGDNVLTVYAWVGYCED